MYGHAGVLLSMIPLAVLGAKLTEHMSPALAKKYRETTAVSGKPGVRVDAQGREFYSAAWIGKP